MFGRKIDFTNPFVVRKWLGMLNPDADIGYLMEKRMKYPSSKLGFSIDSNQFGLRGPSAEFAENVILGTSYGMGFGVDIGSNWYELGMDASNWFNAALPVGPCEWAEILNRFYRGSHKHALFIYHPNFMLHGVTYLKWKKTGKSVFEHLGWKTSLLDCAKIRIRSVARDRENRRVGRVLYVRDGGEVYKINSTYSSVSESDLGYLSEVYSALMRVLCRFERVTVVRVRIKEEMVPVDLQNDFLRRTFNQYDALWASAKDAMQRHDFISFHEAPSFGLSAYNPYDTHWNSKGNECFAKYLTTKFNNFE